MTQIAKRNPFTLAMLEAGIRSAQDDSAAVVAHAEESMIPMESAASIEVAVKIVPEFGPPQYITFASSGIPPEGVRLTLNLIPSGGRRR